MTKQSLRFNDAAMTVLFFLSFFVASMLAATAYLQSDSSWWTGLTGALVLIVLGFLGVFLVPEIEVTGYTSPVVFLVIGVWWCAGIIGLGSASALVLRRFRSAGQVAGIVFLGGWILTFLWFLT
ncbi:hypothetical protein [Ruegeria meonggei]|uniref:Uncharacterized protein n=1 Tax=Ruegeria meonggei TaxID=1446476 RepID=A0A1X6Y648_9RHOB|nr:hypothetical protein [Ruegeria meonggei]SLN11814.1 hypothetical protein RUM8411_00194 [Ruegeria meonggei]